MVRSILAASVAFALVSGVALAEPAGGSVTTVTRTDHGKMVAKRFVNHRGEMVTKRKIIRNGIAGSSVTRSRSVTDPVSGTTYIHKRTELR